MALPIAVSAERSTKWWPRSAAGRTKSAASATSAASPTWLTVGRRFGTRRKVAAAIIDRVEVKRLAEVTPREIERDNPELRRHEELLDFLAKIYGRKISLDDLVTVIHFSRIEEGAADAGPPITGLGGGD